MHTLREHWASRVAFILAAAGSAIGLGSLWRFPYIAGENGGGAFVLLYVLFTVIVGLPIFMGEIILGRASSKSAVVAYSSLSHHSTNWRMLGWFNVVSCLIIYAFYTIVSGWCLSYTLMSITQFSAGKSPEEIRQTFTYLLQSPLINMIWVILFLLMNLGVVYSGVRKGIEHWTRILMPMLFALILALLLYGMTMPGFKNALSFVLYPDFSKITPKAILAALGMACFTLSVGGGIILTYGSYMSEKEDIPKNSFIVALMTLVASVAAALVIFPVTFSFGLPAEGGAGLIFQTMPILFKKLPGGMLLSILFFTLMVFTALTSTISLLEVLVSNFMETYDISRKKASLIASLLALLITIPCSLSWVESGAFASWSLIYGKTFFDTLNDLASNWMLPVGALFTSLFLGWKLPKTAVLEEFSRGSDLAYLAPLWLIMIRYIAPAAILVILCHETGIVNLSHLFGGS